MSTYTAPQRTKHKRSLSRRVKILLSASTLIPLSLFAITITPASATPKFATLQDIQDAINTTLAPIQSAIASLQQQQNSQAQQISNLQNTQSKTLHVLDANNQDLGFLATDDPIYNQVVVYNATSDKLIRLFSFDGVHTIGLQAEVYYTSSDCSGTAYIQGDTLDKHLLNVLGNYMQVDNTANVQTLTIHSLSDPNCQPVNNSIQRSNLHPLIASTSPYQYPVAYPLQFKYQ